MLTSRILKEQKQELLVTRILELIVALFVTIASLRMRPKTAGGNSGTKVPGPGAYDQTSRILNQSVCGVKIGTGCRGELYDGERAAPGPGAYNLRPSTAGSGPKYG